MAHPKEERTLIVIKPDGVQRALVGEVIRRYERTGLKLVALKMFVPTEEMIEGHYLLDPDWRRTNGEKTIRGYKDKGLTPPSEDPLELSAATLKALKVYLTSGPVVAMVWEGAHAVELGRKVSGTTEPRTAAIGTIRADYALDSYLMADTDKRAVRNVIHASGAVSEAEMEIPHWFKPEEIINYRIMHEAAVYEPDAKCTLD